MFHAGLCVLACALQVWACSGARVLVVLPTPGRSRAVLGDALVGTLLQAGHEVVYVSPWSSLPPRALLSMINISSAMENESEKERLSVTELVNKPRPVQRLLEVGTALARRAIQHNNTQQLLADKEQTFDLVVADWFYTGLLAPLSHVYSCPLVWYTATDASWLSLQLVQELALTADPQARSTQPELSVIERASRLWRQAYLTGWAYYMTHYVEAPLYYELYKDAMTLRGQALPEYEALVNNGSMLLLNSHPVLGESLSMPQNAKYVGGHHIEIPTKPLPQGLQKLLDRSTKGVIFLSLGSSVGSKALSERMRINTKPKLLDLLGALEQTVLWKFEETLLGTPRNVHVIKWAPQTSILNHTNTVLLMTHGGFTSYMEATYFGVPIIGVPLFGDQFHTMDLAEAKGRGIRVDFSEYLPYKMYDAIHKILGDVSYQNNAQKASAIFQHPLVPPARELLHWTELALQHGGGHLKSPAHQLSNFQKLHLDILTLVLLFLWFCSKVLKVIRVHWNSHDEEEIKKNQ